MSFFRFSGLGRWWHHLPGRTDKAYNPSTGVYEALTENPVQEEPPRSGLNDRVKPNEYDKPRMNEITVS